LKFETEAAEKMAAAEAEAEESARLATEASAREKDARLKEEAAVKVAEAEKLEEASRLATAAEAEEKAKTEAQAHLAAEAQAARLAEKTTEKSGAEDLAELSNIEATRIRVEETARIQAEAEAAAEAAEQARQKAEKEAQQKADALAKAREDARLAAQAAARLAEDEKRRAELRSDATASQSTVPPPAAAEETANIDTSAPLNDEVNEDLQDALAKLPTLRILFGSQGNQLTAGSINVLDQLADILKEHPQSQLIIEGHTDATGDPDQNLDLSLLRATTVRDYLAVRGVSSNNIRAIGYGEAAPLVPNNTPEGRAINRRIEFTFR